MGGMKQRSGPSRNTIISLNIYERHKLDPAGFFSLLNCLSLSLSLSLGIFAI